MSKVERKRENLLKCLCKSCPSYTLACKIMGSPGNIILLFSEMDDQKLHAETMFCAFEKSQCINEEQGCLCPKCEVHDKYDLENMYFCTKTDGK